VNEAILALALLQAVVSSSTGVSTVRSDGSTRTTVRNLNGREVPVETVQDTVVTNTPGLRVVERTIRRYDANGRPGPPEKQRIETRTGANESTEVTTTTWRGDLSGSLQLAERSLALTRKSGENADTSVTVERPTSDGRLEIHEKKEQSVRAVGQGRVAETSTTQRRDVNGRWIDVLRSTREETRSGQSTVENQAEYEAATSGQMRLVRQTVSRTTSSGSGASTTEIDVFEPAIPGRAPNPEDRPKLTRQQIVERSTVPGGTVETLSVRFVDPSSPGRLGPVRKVEETTCKGECQPAMMK
jgi:hypothetical protein